MNQNAPARQGQKPPAKRQDEGPSPLMPDLSENHPLFAHLLGVDPDDKLATRFKAAVFQACQSNDRLLRADRFSLMQAIGEIAAKNLNPNPDMGEVYMIPRWNKDAGCELVDVQTGYPGLIKLMNRGTPIDWIHADVVRKGDMWDPSGGTNPQIVHKPPPIDGELPQGYDSDDSILAAYAVVMLRGSSRPYTAIVRRAKIIEAAEKSGKRGSKDWSPVWRSNFEEMAKKTALRRVAKKVPGADEAAEMLGVEAAREDGQRSVLRAVSENMQVAAASGGQAQASSLDGLVERTPLPAGPNGEST